MKHISILLIVIVLGYTGLVNGQTPDFTGYKVMINPGHGGYDSDDRGMPNGYWESDGNLTKGLWLRDLLEARGCEVIMSRVLNRTEDDLPLSQIAGMANDNNVHLFIAIHSNAWNQVSNYAMTIFNGKSETPSIPAAKVWAQILWEHLVTNEATFWTSTSPHYIGDLTLNPSWTDGYGVLYPLVVPGIISEGSFHDYQPEMDRLLNLDYRQQEAWHMLYAMEDYFNLAGTEPHAAISGIIRDSLLTKDNYTIPNSPDKYMNVNGTVVELEETGEIYNVDSLETGFYMFDSLVAGTYHLIFSAKDYINDTVEVIVSAHEFSYHNHWLTADRTIPPKIISHSPEDGETIKCFDPVRITFNMNMDSASFTGAFHISPEAEGLFNWDEDYLNVNFQPDVPYETNTEYTVVIDTTAEHQWGVGLDSTLTFSFTTDNRNRYLIESSFPVHEQNEVSPYLQFRLIFDAPLNNASLINAVTIITDEGTVLSTKGAIISTIDGKGHYYFSPEEDLEYEKNYTLQLLGSIMDVGNFPLVDTVKIAFSTMQELGNLIILDEFDDVSNWSINFNESVGILVGSLLNNWTETMRSGDASMLLRYNFLTTDAYCKIIPVAPISLSGYSTEIGIWIWGEMSKNEIKIGFDNGTEVDLCTIDFAGWNYCRTDLPGGVTAITHCRVVRTAEGSKGGDLYFDALSQPGTTAVSNVKHGLNLIVFPNPVVGTELKISGLPDGESNYKIYSITGYKMQEGKLSRRSSGIQLNKNVKDQSVFILNITNHQKSVSLILTNWP